MFIAVALLASSLSILHTASVSWLLSADKRSVELSAVTVPGCGQRERTTAGETLLPRTEG